MTKSAVLKSCAAVPFSRLNLSALISYLFPTKAKTTKRKTPVVKKNLNPHYGHTFVYKDLSPEQLEGMCLELTVWDREAMSSNEFLGGVRLGSKKGKRSINQTNDRNAF